jgi:hypothetical protein
MAEDTANPKEAFVQRTIDRLEAELGGKASAAPVEEEALIEAPPETAESEDEADGALSADETEDDLEALDEAPEGEEAEVVDWEKRYNDQQSELGRYQEERESSETEHSTAMAEILRARYDLEDRMSEQDQQGKFLVQMTTASADRFRNINWANVPPDQLPALQQQAQQAMMQEQQVTNAYNQQVKRATDIKEQATGREAVIARQRLTRTIPDFDNVYPEMAKYAAGRGMDRDQFNQIVDPAVMEMIYDSMTLRNAPDTITTKKQPKARPPTGRVTQTSSRGLDGKFKKAEEAFRKTTDPKQRKIAWEEKTKLRLAKEQRR